MYARFVLKEQWLNKITNVITQLQELCTNSQLAVGDKRKGFVIDPDNTMLPILSAVSTVRDLERAWRLLVQRISCAQEKLDKNFKLYRQEEVPSSPASTDPLVYEKIRRSWEPDAVMAHLYGQVPLMQKLLTNDEYTMLEQGRNLRSALASPFELKAVFPDRQPEELPSQVYYNDNGTKINSADPGSL